MQRGARTFPSPASILPILLALLLQGCAARAPRQAPQPHPASERPNIVLLFADDLGYGDLSSYGHPTIKTPHLDQMGAEGVRMTSFYAAAPVCTPSRAALLTGRYPLRTGLPGVLGPESDDGLRASEITLAEALQERGYRTVALGKWHLGSTRPEHFPTAHGFEGYLGLLYSNDMVPPWVQTERPLRLYRNAEPTGEYPVDQATLTERYTEEAVAFIRASAGEPFFVYLAYAMPHLPLAASPKFAGRSRGGLYGDVIEEIDWSVGRILETLRREGLDRSTIVVFTSDNGPWMNLPERMLQQGVERSHAGSPGPLRGWKGTTYEGGLRVPGIVRWPGRIPGGQVSADIATTMDLYATLLTAAGAQVPQDRPVDGNDLMPMLRSGADSPTTRFYYFRGERLEGVRDRNWKLRLSSQLRDDLAPGAPVTPELYDLEVDPAEHYNVADRHPEVVSRLWSEMRRFASEVGAELEPNATL